MKKVTVLGANSRIAQLFEKMAVNNPDIELTLLFHVNKEIDPALLDSKIIVGDATNADDVRSAVSGADIVYASLAGDVITQAKVLVKVMDEEKVQRLIWTSTLGIYNEIPGEFGRWNQQIMRDYYHRYRLAADVIEASDLKYTIVRPAWMTDLDEVDYETTTRDQPFRGTEISRKSVASYVFSLIEDPNKDVYDSIGINKPGTEADRPRPEVMKVNHGYEPDVKENIKVKYKTING